MVADISKGTIVRVLDENTMGDDTAWYLVRWVDSQDPARRFDGWVQAHELSGQCADALAPVRNQEVVLLQHTGTPNSERFSTNTQTQPSNTRPTPAVPTRLTNAPPELTTQTAQAYSQPQNARREAQDPVARPSNHTDTMTAHIAREQTDTNTVFGVLSEEDIDAAVNNPNRRALAEWITSETLPRERNRAQQPETQALTPEEWRHLVMQIPTDTSPFCAGMPPPYTGFTNNDRLRRLVNEYNAHSQCLLDTDQRDMQRARETVVALGGTVGDDGSVHLQVNARCDRACNDALLERFRGWEARRARLALHNETFQRQMHDFQRRIP